MGIFDGIDFNNLPKDFKEDSVREEIIMPFLKCLGYSAFDQLNCIIRSPHLEHPFIQFGTKSNKVKEIPDYLIKVNKKNAFILEAKSPSENILTGKNVEQAYSYAINREVQVTRFVLCNGKEIAIFDVNAREPLLYFKLANASENDWGKVYELLSPAAFTKPHIFDYKPDYGIWCVRNGMNQEVLQHFYNCFITDVLRLEDNLFTFMAVLKRNGEEFLGSFDFDMELFEDFMKQVPYNLKDKVRNSLRKSPFRYMVDNETESFPLTFSAYLSEYVIKDKDEEYIPLKVENFT